MYQVWLSYVDSCWEMDLLPVWRLCRQVGLVLNLKSCSTHLFSLVWRPYMASFMKIGENLCYYNNYVHTLNQSTHLYLQYYENRIPIIDIFSESQVNSLCLIPAWYTFIWNYVESRAWGVWATQGYNWIPLALGWFWKKISFFTLLRVNYLTKFWEHVLLILITFNMAAKFWCSNLLAVVIY